MIRRFLSSSSRINSRLVRRFSAESSGDSAFAQAMRDKQQQNEANKPEIESDETKQNSTIGWAIGLGLLSSYLYLGQSHESDDIEGENEFQAHNRRSLEAIVSSYEYFVNPPTKTLLPPLPAQMARPYTVCIELSDALTHVVWDKEVGWRVAIRPGARQLLYTLHQYFEVVIFTSTPSHLAQPVIDALDNFGMVHYRLYREHTRLEKDTHLKDLSFLNRDLAKIIVIDTDTRNLATHPENGLYLKPWKGESGDHEIEKFTSFLQELFYVAQAQKLTDLRPLLMNIKEYGEKDIPTAWSMHKDRIKKEVLEKLEVVGPSTSLLSSVSGTLQALVGKGLSGSSSQPGATAPLERIEKYCADLRIALNKEFASHIKNAEKYRQEQDVLIQQQIQEMKQGNHTLIDYLTGNVPQPGAPKEKAAK